MKGHTQTGQGNRKIGHGLASAKGAPDASKVKAKTKGGKSPKSATKFRT